MSETKLSVSERFFVAIMRLNKLEQKQRITKKWLFGRLEITFDWRSKKNMWGRFGGGWNWKLGFQASGRTIKFNLLIFSICFHLAAEALKDAEAGE
jgi:hypothetical protein